MSLSPSKHFSTDFAKQLVANARRGTVHQSQAAVSQAPYDGGIARTDELLWGDPRDVHVARLRRKVSEVKLTDRQLRDGAVAQPSIEARRNAQQCVTELYELAQLVPRRIAASVEGGVFLLYCRGDEKDLRLEIEVDNEGDRVGVLSNRDGVLSTTVINDPVKTNRLVQQFRFNRPFGVRESTEAVGR